jgi:hypothetical protein
MRPKFVLRNLSSEFPRGKPPFDTGYALLRMLVGPNSELKLGYLEKEKPGCLKKPGF